MQEVAWFVNHEIGEREVTLNFGSVAVVTDSLNLLTSKFIQQTLSLLSVTEPDMPFHSAK